MKKMRPGVMAWLLFASLAWAACGSHQNAADAGDAVDGEGEADGVQDPPAEDAADGDGPAEAGEDLADLPADEPDLEPPPRGPVVPDGDHPAWLKYRDAGPFFMCGSGDPEDFLYRGDLNTDGTRNGDQTAMIEKLAGTGANAIYMQAVRSHGGDGDATHNPFVDHDPALGLNEAVLDQWEGWFQAMDESGIVIFFFFYDDSARIWDTGDSVGDAERSFVQALVDRFEHHDHLIWSVAEEYQERYSAQRVSAIAAVIKAADDAGHAVAVHKLHGLDFSELADDPSLDQFAIQYNVETAGELHAGMLEAFSGAAGRYNLNMAEAAGYGTGADARAKDWAVAMAGAYVMALGWDIVTTPVETLRDCGTLRTFFESTSFYEMAPHDELAHGETLYVLALPGESYIAYVPDGSGAAGFRGMTAGTYDLRWLDIATGTVVEQAGVDAAGGDQAWERPAGIGSEAALHAVRR
jgi:hypothetical protein